MFIKLSWVSGVSHFWSPIESLTYAYYHSDNKKNLVLKHEPIKLLSNILFQELKRFKYWGSDSKIQDYILILPLAKPYLQLDTFNESIALTWDSYS